MPAGAALVVDVTLPLDTLSDTIEVVAPSPMVDVTSPAANQNIPQSFLWDLPTNRSVPDLINLVPGVGNQVAFGGTQGSNALTVDGLDMTSQGFSAPALRLDQNWLQEIQVTSLGAGAATGNTTGLSANVVLRSGSNRLAGLGDLRFSRPDWLASNTGRLVIEQQSSFAPRRIDDLWDLSVQAGTPVVRDRLWAFTGYRRSVVDDRPAGYAGDQCDREARFAVPGEGHRSVDEFRQARGVRPSRGVTRRCLESLVPRR